MTAGQRVDKWLWHARVAKTRTLAASLVTGGHVRLNAARIARASQPVRPGDVLTIALRGRVLVLRVEAIGERRGPASEAQSLYCDLSPPPPPAEEADPGSRPRGEGRPTKRDRRRIDAWKNDLKAPDEEEI